MNGKIQTDLHIKPTDSRSYLSYDSCHPNHMFAGIVYTQALRLRRIISEDDRLATQLNLLAEAFLKCRYPSKLVSDIVEKVKTLPRVLKKQQVETEQPDRNVLMVSTYGADKPLQDIVSKLPNKDKLLIKNVHKTAPSLRVLLCTPRKTCHGPSKGKTEKCNRPKCLCCNLISGKNCVSDSENNRSFKTAKANCITRNVTYHLKCKISGTDNIK